MTKEELLTQAGALLLDTIKQIKDFSIKEIPPTIREAVMYQVTIHWIWLTICTICTGLLLWLSVWWYKKSKCNPDGPDHWIRRDDYEPAIFLWGTGCIIFGCFAIANAFNILRYYIAPRIFTIQVIKSLL